MCYDIKANLEAQLKRARFIGDKTAILEIEEKLIPLTDLPIHHASGFSHPELLIYTDESPNFPYVASWGLVPSWVRDNDQLKSIWNKTLNARGETIFDKPSFRTSARKKRCLIYVNGFYEHHHYNKKTFPFYIYRKDSEPLILAGLWSTWVNPDTGGELKTFTIVTTEGNELLSKLHNNPKLKGPRMPLILPEEMTEIWLEQLDEELVEKRLNEVIQSFPDAFLTAHPVKRLRGKEYLGNVETISERHDYAELDVSI